MNRRAFVASKVSDQTARILAVLDASPSGLTVNDVAKHLGISITNAGSRLSKLVSYGVIDKRRVKLRPNTPMTSVYLAPTLTGS